jgi:preprotein translocase subunit SecY
MPYITSVDHHADPGVVIPKLEEWQEQGAVGQAQDHAVDPLPVTIGIAVLQSTGFVFCSRTVAAACRRTRTSPSSPNFNLGRVLLIVLLHRRHRAADVDGRADHPARHRQRHVAHHLLSVVSAFPSVGASLRASNGWFAVLLVSSAWPCCC